MKLLSLILKILGTKNFSFKKIKNKKEIIINFDENNNFVSKIINTNNINKYILNILKYLVGLIYSLSILSLILLDNIFCIIYSIIVKDYKYLISCFMSFNLTIQYLLNIIYFNLNKKKLNEDIRNIYLKYVSYIWMFIIPINIIISILPIIFLYTNIKVTIYSEILNNSTLLYNEIVIIKCSLYLSIIGKLYSYNVFIFNAILFIFTFIYHIKNFKKYVKKIKNKLDDSISIESIIEEYLTIKENYEKDVDNLNNIFGFSTISLIILGYNFTLYINNFNNSKYLSIIHIIDIAFLLIIEIIHIICISKVKKNIDDLKNIMFSNNTISNLMSKYKTVNIITEDTNNIEVNNKIEKIFNKIKQINDLSMKSLVCIYDTSKKVDWITLISIINKSWKTFNILGFSINDSTRIKQIIGIIGSFSILLSLFIRTVNI